ncbi:uncharacterized protein FOMMEDRAFT_146750 [Fomitiporia mediterranea MF3/22]|uniref:uncharacterized protein n=1 Tax=Fomitiporia mediterranea (strain MF3/22) TaxID=694068 RepID=UPI0004407383|nr:uncharacterized protein FOMMEDRAFT_146750 [Fomitiporia mediterranea MF3/22]EJD03029.1 hypothetical protein FOMMEDRAFT_146750 [Fomitiporia mediterranea MF3/22]
MSPRGNGGGRSRGRSRGSSPFRGRPGGQGQYPYRGRGGRGGQPVYRNLDVIDVDIQQYSDDIPTSGTISPAPSFRGRGRGNYNGRGRGRGYRGGTSTPLNLKVYAGGYRTPPPPRREDWSGTVTPTGRGAGRGPSRGLGARYNPNLPLSKLLALDRPYLRPINFVPAQLTPVLFQHEEELIEVHEFHEPEDHVPTAQQVTRVFSHKEQPPQQDAFFQNTEVDLFAEVDEAPIMTVDFNSLGKLMDDVSASQETPVLQAQSAIPAESPAVGFGQGESIFDSIKEALSIKPGDTMDMHSYDVQTFEADETGVDPSSQITEGLSVSATEDTIIRIEDTVEEEAVQSPKQPLFVVDANPSGPSQSQGKIVYTPSSSRSQPLGSQLPEDDEIIVYDAPHPRSGPATPSVTTTAEVLRNTKDSKRMPAQRHTDSSNARDIRGPQPSSSADPQSSKKAASSSMPFAGMSFSFDALSKAAEINRQQSASPRARRLTKRDRQTRVVLRNGKNGKKKRTSFTSFGAMLEEMHLHEDEFGGSSKRGRREGSDIDWGSGHSGSEAPGRAVRDDPEIDRVSSGLEGMDIDGDLDMKAMQSFVGSMSKTGMEYTTIDDIEDAEKLRLEDEEDEDSSSGSEEQDSEIEAILRAEEEGLVGDEDNMEDFDSESDEDDEDDDSSDDDESAMQRFQTRLSKARQSAKAKGKMKETAFSAAEGSSSGLFGARMSKLRDRNKPQTEEDEEDEDEDEDFDENFTWAEADDDYINDIQDLLDDNDDILHSDRKQRKALFKSVLNGDFSVAPAKKKRDYGKDLPPELRVLWEKDRAKKAENKRKRAAARLEAAMDPFAKHKGGKKGRKALLKASRLAAEARDETPSNASPDITVIVQQIRSYIDNISLTSPMALPPMDRESRAMIHEIAAAFGLKSQSKGKGETRYTTLIKTSRSGVGVKERKIERILRSGGNWGFTRPGNPGGGNGGKRGGAPKHKEGDEVGKAAPRIGENNVGFRMLAGMGWSEGEKIGISGGLDAPITAIIKHSKLGLGATR